MAKQKRIWVMFFVLYCAAMGFLLFGRKEAVPGIPYTDQLLMRLNLIPFRTVRRQMHLLTAFDRPWLVRHSLVNLLGNVVLFIPLGIFLPTLWEKLRGFRPVLLAVAGLILAVETVQVLTLLGRGDIDDLILNLIGAAIGYGIYLWTEEKRLPG